MRALISFSDDDVRWLDQKAAREGKSRAAVVRAAVAALREAEPVANDSSWIDNVFGLWANRTDIGDAVEWQRRERASWTKAWDNDYEAVKAEFPDLFDAEDDRQRQIYMDMLAGRYPEPKTPE